MIEEDRRARYVNPDGYNDNLPAFAEETYAGMVSDMGDLGRLILAKEGFREMPDMEKNLPHELAELLYAVLLLANHYGIDLSKAFLDEIARLQRRLSK